MDSPFFQKLTDFFSKYKYIIVLVLFLVITGVASDNSLIRRVAVRREIRGLQQQLQDLDKTRQANEEILLDLNNDSVIIEHLAREKYNMHRADEDVFIENVR